MPHAIDLPVGLYWALVILTFDYSYFDIFALIIYRPTFCPIKPNTAKPKQFKNKQLTQQSSPTTSF